MVGDMTFVSMVMVSLSPTRSASVCERVCACVCISVFMCARTGIFVNKWPSSRRWHGGYFIDTVKSDREAQPRMIPGCSRQHAIVSSSAERCV